MFCNAVSKEVCDRKESIIAKPRFKTETIVRNQDSRSCHLQIQQSLQAISRRQSKESLESHLLKKDLVNLISHQEK